MLRVASDAHLRDDDLDYSEELLADGRKDRIATTLNLVGVMSHSVTLSPQGRREPLHQVHEGTNAHIHADSKTDQIEAGGASKSLYHYVLNFLDEFFSRILGLHQGDNTERDRFYGLVFQLREACDCAEGQLHLVPLLKAVFPVKLCVLALEGVVIYKEDRLVLFDAWCSDQSTCLGVKLDVLRKFAGELSLQVFR